MRQAYDYWQNQPGNYLERREAPPSALPPRQAGRKRCCYRRCAQTRRPTRMLTCASERARGSPHGKAVGTNCWLPLSPSKFPRTRSAGTERASREVAECRLGAPRGDRRPERSAIQRPSAGGYLLLLFASELAIGQSSTEPIQQLPGVNPWEAIARRPTQQPPGRPRSWGLEPAMNPP